MKKRLESRKLLNVTAAIPSSQGKIIFTKAPLIQYEQLLLDKNVRQYLEKIMVYKNILRIGAQKTPIHRTYEINIGTYLIDIDFLGSNRQFDWTELSLVCGKSDKRITIYDSYNIEQAAKRIKSVKLSNFTKIYRLRNEKKMTLTI